MPLQDGLLIAVKDGVVELTATLVEPHRDEPVSFGSALADRLAEHQYQAMTDDSIVGEDLALASCIVCRDPVPDPLKEPLVSCGLAPQQVEAGGRAPRSMFGRLGGTKQRARLEKWSVAYARSRDLDPSLAAFEADLADALPDGDLIETAGAGVRLVVQACRAHFGLSTVPNIDGLDQLERRLDGLRRRSRARWILHPRAVRALAAFTAQCILSEAPQTCWSPDSDDDNPLWVRTGHGPPVATDPEYRVVQLVRRGLRASLSEYVADVVRQASVRP